MKKLILLFLIGMAVGFFTGCSSSTKVETSLVDKTQVFVSPSAGMAVGYVLESKRHVAEFVIGIIALISLAVTIWALVTDRLPNKPWVRVLLAVCAILVGVGLWRPVAAVSSDNQKPVAKSTWEWYKAQPDGEKRFWDSIYHSSRMLNNYGK